MEELGEEEKVQLNTQVVVLNMHLAAYREDGTFVNVLLQKKETEILNEKEVWGLISGHVSENKTLEEGIVEELKKQTQIDGNIIIPIGIFSNKNKQGKIIHTFACMTIVLSAPQQPIEINNPSLAMFKMKAKFITTGQDELKVELRSVQLRREGHFKTKFSRGKYGMITTEVAREKGDLDIAPLDLEILSRALLKMPELTAKAN